MSDDLRVRCSCSHEAGDSDCAKHPGCPYCGESLESTRLHGLVASLTSQHTRDLAEIARLDGERARLRAEVERMRAVYEAAVAWRDTWRHRRPFGDESKAVLLVDAVDAAEMGSHRE